VEGRNPEAIATPKRVVSDCTHDSGKTAVGENTPAKQGGSVTYSNLSASCAMLSRVASLCVAIMD
jgi:hypothetical protein